MTIRTYMRGVAGDDEDREDSRRLIFVGEIQAETLHISSFVNASFVGTMPDTLIIHYAKHKRETGIMKMKKVRHGNDEKDDIRT